MPVDKQKVLNGRKAVETYRVAHAQLYTGSKRTTIPEEHTPLLEKLLSDLKAQGFNSLDEVFVSSGELDSTEGIEKGKRWR